MLELAAAVVPSVAIMAGCVLQGLRMYFAHSSKKLEHAPVAELQTRLSELETRLLAGAMRGR